MLIRAAIMVVAGALVCAPAAAAVPTVEDVMAVCGMKADGATFDEIVNLLAPRDMPNVDVFGEYVMEIVSTNCP